MNSTSDNNKSSLKGVYMFYSVIITLCVLALFVFDLNIYAKAVLCMLVFLCVLVMRSIRKAVLLPPNIDPDTMQEVEPVNDTVAEATSSKTEATDSAIRNDGAVDLYLTLLIEADEELSKDPGIDRSSPSYNNLLNRRIGMKLDAML